MGGEIVIFAVVAVLRTSALGNWNWRALLLPISLPVFSMHAPLNFSAFRNGRL